MNEYYILGTKYGEHNNVDIMPQLIENNVVSIGFVWDIDLSQYYNRSSIDLEKLLKLKGEKPSTIAQVKRFLSLKPGDIIALKSVGAPIGKTARLEIVGYALVVERDNVIYSHNPRELGHTINVEFIETDFKKTVQLGYGRTIHKLVDKDHIDKVFGLYSDLLNPKKQQFFRSATKQKNTSSTVVKVNSSYFKTAIHNIVQQGVYDKFVDLLGEDKVSMEENYVDIIIRGNGKTELIEIKPYTTAMQCIREGLGQLLSYYHNSYSSVQNVSIKIIGRNNPNPTDNSFIKFIQNSLDLEFSYDSWERIKDL